MPDQFKNFLQEHRNDIDDRNVPADLFDQIMEKSFSAQKTSYNLVSQKRSIFYYAIRMAAVSVLLVGVYFAIQFNNSNNQQKSIADTDTNQKKENQLTPNLIHETIDSNHSNEIEIKNQIETVSPVASQIKVVNNKPLKNKSINKEVLGEKQDQTPTPNFLAVQNANNIIDKAEIDSNVEVVESIVQNANHSEISSQAQVEELKPESKEVASIESPTPVTKNDQMQSNPQSERGIISLDEKVKKGIFSFLSKKSRQWSNNTIAIDPKLENKNTKLEIQVKTDQLAFNKSLKISSF